VYHSQEDGELIHAVNMGSHSEDSKPVDPTSISPPRQDIVSPRKSDSNEPTLIKKLHMKNIAPHSLRRISRYGCLFLLPIKDFTVEGYACYSDDTMAYGAPSRRLLWDLSQLESLEFIDIEMINFFHTFDLSQLSGLRTLKIKGSIEKETEIADLSDMLEGLLNVGMELEELQVAYDDWGAILSDNFLGALGAKLRKLHLQERRQNNRENFLSPHCLASIQTSCGQLSDMALDLDVHHSNVS
jgi:hypothetical protein